MRNIVLVTRLEGILDRKFFLNLEDIAAISIPEVGTCELILRNGEHWTVSSEEWEYIMHNWASYYVELAKYKEYIKE